MSKILFVLPSGSMGGAERVVYNIASYLSKDNYEICIVILTGEPSDNWRELSLLKNVEMISLRASREIFSILPFTLTLLKNRKKFNFRFCFSTHGHVNALLSVFRRWKLLSADRLISRESTFIFERFTGLKGLMIKLLYRLCYGTQDLIICQSEKMRESFIDNMPSIEGQRVIVAPNPVALREFPPICHSFLSNAEIISLDNIKKGQYIVTAGRLIALKNFSSLIKAFAKLRSKHTSTKLVVLGEGGEHSSLVKLACDLGVAEAVVFLGQVKEPLFWFKSAAVGILPSYREGFPNVVLEMMQAGIRQVVCTPCTDAVLSLPNIVITQGFDSDSLYDALDMCLDSESNNSSVYESYISAHHSVEKFWQRIS